MIKACIFDLDGVIVDTAHYHFLAWKRLADELNIPFTEHDNERLKGVSRLRSMDILLEIGGVSMNTAQKESLANRKNGWFVDYIRQMKADEIFPGVKSLIEQLQRAGIKVALASSSKNAKTVIALLGIEKMFEVVVDGTMVTHSKPDPEIFLKAADLLQTAATDCLVFEDAEAGVEAALAAGMKCIGIGNETQLRHATKVIPTTATFQIQDLQKL